MFRPVQDARVSCIEARALQVLRATSLLCPLGPFGVLAEGLRSERNRLQKENSVLNLHRYCVEQGYFSCSIQPRSASCPPAWPIRLKT